MQKRPDLLTGSISKNIISLAMPMVFVMILQTLFNIADTIFVGRISAYAVAAVSMAFAVMFIIIAIGGGIGIGTSSLIARRLGAGDKRGADLAAEHAVFLGLGISLFISVFGLALAKPLFAIMGAGPEILPLVISYIRILFMGMVFLVMGMVGVSIFQGEGDTKTPMKIMGFAVILNIILDPIFIFTLGYGVAGAAIATVLSRGIGTALIWYFLLSNRALIQFDLRSFVYDSKTLRGIISVGFPSMVMHVAMGVGMAVLMKLTSLFGPLAIAAYGIGFRIESVAILPALGIAMAVVTIVGQNVGAGNFDRAKKTVWNASILAGSFALLAAIVILLFPIDTITLFNSDPLVVEYGVSLIRIVSLSLVLAAVGIIVSNGFQGAGNGAIPLFLTIFRLFILIAPLSYLLATTFGYGVPGIWMGVAVGNIVFGIVSVVWFRLFRLQKKI